MATNIVDFVPGVAPAVPLCPTKIIRDNIIESARIFCEKSKIWIKDLDPISQVANQPLYDLTAVQVTGEGDTLGNLYDMVGIEHVEIDQQSLDFTSERYLNSNERGWRRHSQNVPRRCYGTPDRQLRLVFNPSSNRTDVIDVWVSVMPLRTATVVDDFLFTDWKRGIEYGAIALLKEIPSMPFTDVQSSMYYWNRFQEELDIALERKMSGYDEGQSSIWFTPDESYV